MSKEIRIAILAIITAALTIWGYKFIAGKNLLSGDKTYYGIYDNVQDVNTATKVQINGMVVGAVISIDAMPEDVRKIKLGFTVKKDILLPKNAIAELRSASPLGGKSIELLFDKMATKGEEVPGGSIIKSKSIGLLGSLVSEEEMTPYANTLTDAIDKTIGDLGNPESEDALDVSIHKLSQTMSNFASLTEKMNRMMINSQKNIEVTMGNMAVITNSLVNSQSKLNQMLDNLNGLTADLSQVKISETIGKSNDAIDQATASLKGVEQTMSEVSLTMNELKSIMEKMDNGEGTLGQLINDKSLYNNLTETTREVDLLLQDIRLNPRRYFKLFGKKVPDYELPEDDPAGK